MSTITQRRLDALRSEHCKLKAENKKLKATLDAIMRSRDRIIDEWTPPPSRIIAKHEGK